METSTQPQSGVRTVLMATRQFDRPYRPDQLLGDSGLEVACAQSPLAASEALRSGPPDLLILELPAFLPVCDDLGRSNSRSPKHVAIICDSVCDVPDSVRHSLRRSKVHVFPRPLHLHGILSLVRRLERKTAVA